MEGTGGSGRNNDKGKPVIVCLCGSTRFVDVFDRVNNEETVAGRIVLSVGSHTKPNGELFRGMPREEWDDLKWRLDELHLRKIDMADEVLILNVGGYIGESTNRELEYAARSGKRLRFLEPPGWRMWSRIKKLGILGR